jgi:pyridoxal phosphate enzyme (YggS family)
MSVQSNLKEIKDSLPEGVTLVAVSKTKPVEEIMKAYNSGQRIFGENRVQEIISKKDLLPQDIEWHLIGHLQTNKVKFVVPFISMIHSVDSERLLKTINNEAGMINRVIDVLVQFHIALESSKFGFSYEEAETLISSGLLMELKNIRVCGVMGMATFTDNIDLVRKEFRTLNGYFNRLKSRFFQNNENFNEISMGMSDDYHIAIEEGSTMVRVGSSIFGKR